MEIASFSFQMNPNCIVLFCFMLLMSLWYTKFVKVNILEKCEYLFG